MKSTFGFLAVLTLSLAGPANTVAQMIPIVLDDMLIMVPNPEVRPIAKRLLGQGSILSDGIGSDYTTAVGMTVPGFRGLEPSVGLSYSSSQSNGFAGMGWALTGLSQITRAGADRGAPRYDSSDVWMLDGMELVPCVAGSVSPSCLSGGTHSTKLESYVRIKRVTTNNWEITAKNGNKSIYNTAFNPTGAEYKTVLTRMIDTRNNTVDFSYVADGSNWIYPNQITYGGMSITFYRESRSDVVSLDAGGNKTLLMNQRLKLVDMKVGANRARAYRVSYSTGVMGNSQVSSVQMYGTTALVDAAGNVSGPYLPPTSFTYTNGSEANTKAELLKEVSNGLAGKSKISYSLATNFPNTGLPVQLYVVSSVAQNDGRNPDRTTTYTYTDGKWDSADQKFLGFLYSKVTLPCITGESACPFIETWYKQDYASSGKPERIERRNGSNLLFSASQFAYEINGAAPFTSKLTTSYEEFHAGTSTSPVCPSATCKRNIASQTYDAYGNSALTTEVYDVGGTNSKTKSTTYTYAVNTSAFITELPASVKITNASGVRLKEERFAYDQDIGTVGDYTVPAVRGDLTHRLTYSESKADFVSHRFAFDSFGNQTKSTDVDGNVTVIKTYDPTYNLFVVNQKNHTSATAFLETNFEWNGVCQALFKRIDHNAVVASTSTFDVFCRTERVDTALGGFQAFEYCAATSATNQCGSVAGSNAQYTMTSGPSADGGAAQWEKTYFDGNARDYRVSSKGPSVTNSSINQYREYDARGNLVKLSVPTYGAATPSYIVNEFDAMNRQTKITDINGKSIRTVYGHLSKTIYDKLNMARTHVVDTRGNVIEEQFVVNGSSYKNTYEFDELSRRIGMNDAEGNRWEWGFDTTGTGVRFKDPDRGTWNYTYSGDNDIVRATDARGVFTNYTTDWMGRNTGLVYQWPSQSSASRSEILKYDEVRSGFFNKGKLTSVVTAVGTTHTFDYDAAGRLAKYVHTPSSARTYTTLYGYDAADRLKWKSLPGGINIGTAASPILYDGAGRQYAIPNLVSKVLYLPDGTADELTFANGVVTDYGFDAAQQVNRIRTVNAGASVLQDLVYGRDDEGKIKSVTSPFSAESWNYTYDDAAKRLLVATNVSSAANSQSFTYSPSGNMLTNSAVGTYSYPLPGANAVRPHAAQSAGGAGFTYDENGNVKTRPGEEYTFDMTNTLGMIIKKNSSNQWIGLNTYFTDHAGQRIGKVVSNNLALPGKFTEYPIPDLSFEEGGTYRALVRINGILVAKVTSLNGTFQTVWLHPNHLGTVNVVSNSSGAEAQRINHRPFGERLSASNWNWEKELSFLGERFDEESNLVYQRSRYYDPKYGRYVSADKLDPSRFDVGANRYAYAGNDPINNRDDGNRVIDAKNGALVNAYLNYARTTGEKPLIFVAGINNPSGSTGLYNNALTAASFTHHQNVIAVGNNSSWGAQYFNAALGYADPSASLWLSGLLSQAGNMGLKVDVAAHSNGNASSAGPIVSYPGVVDSFYSYEANIRPSDNQRIIANVGNMYQTGNWADYALGVSVLAGTAAQGLLGMNNNASPNYHYYPTPSGTGVSHDVFDNGLSMYFQMQGRLGDQFSPPTSIYDLTANSGFGYTLPMPGGSFNILDYPSLDSTFIEVWTPSYEPYVPADWGPVCYSLFGC